MLSDIAGDVKRCVQAKERIGPSPLSGDTLKGEYCHSFTSTVNLYVIPFIFVEITAFPGFLA